MQVAANQLDLCFVEGRNGEQSVWQKWRVLLKKSPYVHNNRREQYLGLCCTTLFQCLAGPSQMYEIQMANVSLLVIGITSFFQLFMLSCFKHISRCGYPSFDLRVSRNNRAKGQDSCKPRFTLWRKSLLSLTVSRSTFISNKLFSSEWHFSRWSKVANVTSMYKENNSNDRGS